MHGVKLHALHERVGKFSGVFMAPYSHKNSIVYRWVVPADIGTSGMRKGRLAAALATSDSVSASRSSQKSK